MKRYEMDQYTTAWWDVRRGVPTCSEFGRIITPATGKLSSQALAYAAELVGQMVDPHYGEEETYVSAAMRNGTIMEPEARDWYEFDAGADVQRVGFCTTDDGRFGGSPDALVGDDGCLELKSPTAKTQVLYLYANTLPAEYRPQVHGHLIVTGRKWCDFVSYFRGLPPLRIRVEPDAYTDMLRKCLDDFWAIYQDVRAKVPVERPAPVTVSEESAAAAMFTAR
jgi:hypothetical protein